MGGTDSNAGVNDPRQTASEVCVPCPVCRESIKPGAKKCIRCTSALDWRRWLGVSETTLALLVALISVVGSTGPRIVELLTPRYSDLRLVLRPPVYQNLQLDAWNKGNKPSYLVSASISAKLKDGSSVAPIYLNNLGPPAVQAGQEVLFSFGLPPAEVPKFLNWPHTQLQTASLIVVVQEYNKPQHAKTFEVPRDQFLLFCRATEDADNLYRHPGQGIDTRSASRCAAPQN